MTQLPQRPKRATLVSVLRRAQLYMRRFWRQNFEHVCQSRLELMDNIAPRVVRGSDGGQIRKKRVGVPLPSRLDCGTDRGR